MDLMGFIDERASNLVLYKIRIYNPSNHPYLLLFFTLRTLSLCGSLKKGLFNPDFVLDLNEVRVCDRTGRSPANKIARAGGLCLYSPRF